MTENILFSIVMPAYNTEKYISEAIESVLCQSYSNWELIIVDDGSTDNSLSIIDDYSSKDQRIKSIHTENGGVSAARNRALKEVKGDYISFIDSDDIYHPKRLETVAGILKEHQNCDLIISRHHEFRDGNIIQLEEKGNVVVVYDHILESVLENTKNQYMCNVTIKSIVRNVVSFQTLKFGEDHCFIRDCACYCKEMVITEQVLYYYRRDNQNAMTNNFFSEENTKEYKKLAENMYEFCMKKGRDDDFFKDIVGYEYAHSCMRIRKCTTYKNFVRIMNDENYRKGLSFAKYHSCNVFEKCLLFFAKHRIYFPFIFWVW